MVLQIRVSHLVETRIHFEMATFPLLLLLESSLQSYRVVAYLHRCGAGSDI